MPTSFPHYGPSDIAALEEDQEFYDQCERFREKQRLGGLFRGKEVRDLVDAATLMVEELNAGGCSSDRLKQLKAAIAAMYGEDPE